MLVMKNTKNILINENLNNFCFQDYFVHDSCLDLDIRFPISFIFGRIWFGKIKEKLQNKKRKTMKRKKKSQSRRKEKRWKRIATLEYF